ncbi:hypothetical protein AAH161_26250, partial [Bacteroides ovatus]
TKPGLEKVWALRIKKGCVSVLTQPLQYPDPNYLNFIQLYSIKVKPSINQPFAILYMSNKYN